MLNRGLRSLDMEAMTKLGFFIRHLHRQLEQLHQEQSANFQTAFTVYRGQGMTKEDFQSDVTNKVKLLSFSKERHVISIFLVQTSRIINNWSIEWDPFSTNAKRLTVHG
ncbi:unnamed protein product [Rotaria magnacalcarata]|uniref:Uncharacterized protein n=2 Tax=Rotaria magnacalcarata TaxID=392030 RepID=A0A8S3JRD2_9BILA|nr:unnamed protein product [Rotaria magnacalcarata]